MDNTHTDVIFHLHIQVSNLPLTHTARLESVMYTGEPPNGELVCEVQRDGSLRAGIESGRGSVYARVRTCVCVWELSSPSA
jgi:hypothetical protein